MKTCINGATTMPYPLEVDVEAAGKAGFQGVEIWRGKLDKYLVSCGKEDLKRMLSNFSLSTSAICAFGGFVWCSEDEFRSRVNEVIGYFELANYIGCESLLVCAEGFRGKGYQEAVDAHADRLSRLADVGSGYDVKIAMEWFESMKTAVDIVEKAGHKYLGAMLDTFHWYRGDGKMENISLIPRGKLLLVHINDCEDLPREKLTDKNRLYCGLGVIPLVEILKRLKELSYEGYLSVEIFRDEYWGKDALTISKESLRTLKEVMMKAGL